MLRFDSEDLLIDGKPDNLSSVLWEVVRDITEDRWLETRMTFFVPESAADLADGGPISAEVCQGGNLTTAIAGDGLHTSVCAATDGSAVWVVTTKENDRLAIILLLPTSEWIPDEIRRVFEHTPQQGGDDV